MKKLTGSLLLLLLAPSFVLAAWPQCDVILDAGSTLNPQNNTVYCLKPGTYAPFTSSTDNWSIRYYDPDNPTWEGNPVHLADNKRVRFITNKIVLSGNNQKLYGIHYNMTPPKATRLIDCTGGTGCEVHDSLVEHGGSSPSMFYISQNGGAYNSIFRDTVPCGVNCDSNCTQASADATGNIELIGNEIYNCAGDGFGLHPKQYNNILIQDNDFYQVKGFAPFNNSEQAMDFKSSMGEGYANGRKIIGNRFFDFRENSDSHRPTAIKYTTAETRHPEANIEGYMLIENNIFLRNGFVMRGDSDGVTFRGNLVTGGNGLVSDSTGLLMRNQFNTELYYNTFVNQKNYVTDAGGGAAENTDALCNVFVGSTRDDELGSGTVFSRNAWYNSDRYAAPGTGDVVQSSASASNGAQFCFDIKQITNPTRVCIPYAKTTSSSPHANLCSGAQVGARQGIGVDNATIIRASAGIYMDESIHLAGAPLVSTKPSIPSRVAIH